MILQNTLCPVMCLFLIVLRRAYINLPYKKWNRGYIILILFRSVILFTLFSFAQTVYLAKMLFFLFSLADVCVYLPSSKSFYILLKGRSIEARWHSTQSDCRSKRLIVVQYFYAQLMTIVGLLFLLVSYFISFIQTTLLIISDSGYAGINDMSIFPKFHMSSGAISVIDYISYNSLGVQWIMTIIFQLFLFLSYTMVCLAIVVKLIRKRKQYNNVNNWATKSLMKNYRNTLDTSYRNYEQKPPFIQAFRSHNNFVY